MTGETFATEQEANDYIFRIITPYKKAYPVEVRVDLTRPSNFVKLLQIVFDINSMHTSLGDWETGTSVQDALIENLIIEIPNNTFYKKEDKNYAELIKHQAQQTQWEY